MKYLIVLLLAVVSLSCCSPSPSLVVSDIAAPPPSKVEIPLVPRGGALGVTKELAVRSTFAIGGL